MIDAYLRLIRLDKPIGIWLLLWPTLWALWLAGNGQPPTHLTLIFVAGVFIMRSAGCVVNDLADRKIDRHVERTRTRPLANDEISVRAALIFAALLGLLAFILVLFCNALTIKLAVAGAALAILYPFLKRMTHLPQVGLGVAFAWSVPMAFAAVTNRLDPVLWWVFAAALLWPIIYDTMYAMADRKDDIKIGVKSTAILFGKFDVPAIILMQLFLFGLLTKIGLIFQLHMGYYFGLLVVLLLFVYQIALIRRRVPQQCFQAFLNNKWVGFVIFFGIASSYL